MAKTPEKTHTLKKDVNTFIALSWELLKKSLRKFGYVVGVFFIFAMYVGAMQVAINAHWIFGLLLSIFLIACSLIAIYVFRSKAQIHLSVWMMMTNYVFIILVASLAFGALSFLIDTFNWAEHQSNNPLDLYYFQGYYLWLFFEMIPALEINKTLGLSAPLQPQGFVAGIPVLLFRIFVLFGLLKALSQWWKNRQEQPVETPLPKAASQNTPEIKTVN